MADGALVPVELSGVVAEAAAVVLADVAGGELVVVELPFSAVCLEFFPVVPPEVLEWG